MRYNALYQLTMAKLRGMLREPEMIFWVFVFPLLLAIALGIAFKSRGDVELPIAVQQGPRAEWMRDVLEEAPGLRAEVLPPDEAHERLRTGKVSLVVIPGATWTYWFDRSRQDGRMAELAVNDALQRAEGRDPGRRTERREITERGSRYIDFLIPGLLGMNLMGTGLWGVGFSIVQSRSRRMLKRLVATPMLRWHYLLSQMLARLVFLIVEVGILLTFARLAFGVPIRGSLITLSLVCVLGALTFAGLGLLVASRTRTIEGVQGLINVVMMPMWLLSGTFFSTARFPDVMQPVVQALPLTAINDSLRAIMLEGASLLEVSAEVLISGVWGVAAFAAALAMFRWS